MARGSSSSAVAVIVLTAYTADQHRASGVNAWDPYPFILLNLFLSMLAAIQAPVIMMSQNRQDVKDRVRSELDYESEPPRREQKSNPLSRTKLKLPARQAGRPRRPFSRAQRPAPAIPTTCKARATNRSTCKRVTLRLQWLYTLATAQRWSRSRSPRHTTVPHPKRSSRPRTADPSTIAYGDQQQIAQHLSHPAATPRPRIQGRPAIRTSSAIDLTVLRLHSSQSRWLPP